MVKVLFLWPSKQKKYKYSNPFKLIKQLYTSHDATINMLNMEINILSKLISAFIQSPP